MSDVLAHARAAVSLALFGALPATWPLGAAAATFSPQAVFTLPDHQYIDDRCQDARKFADRAAKGTADLDATTSANAANAFIACVKLPRLNPDMDQQRYLVLAAATAAYLAGTESTGATALSLFKAADRMAAELGALGPDHTVENVKVVSAEGRTMGDTPHANDADSSSRNEPPHTTYETRRNALGSAQQLKFADIATELRAALGPDLDALEGAPQAKVTSTP